MDEVKELTDRYDATTAVGQKLIQHRWKSLSSFTRQELVSSGLYTERGQRLEASHDLDDLGSEVADLEHGVGALKQCVDAKVPFRSEKGAPIPREALSESVLNACEDLLHVCKWHDPYFLRLALAALTAHQEAHALTVVPPASASPHIALLAIGGLLQVALIALMPAALATGLVAAHEQSLEVAVLAFYVAGAGILAAMSTPKRTKAARSVEEVTHTAWSQFRYLRLSGVAGTGALVYLNAMARDGVRVPSVAFDLCYAIQRLSVAPRDLV